MKQKRIAPILAKYKNWSNAGENASVKNLFASNRQFQEVKQSGVGRDTLTMMMMMINKMKRQGGGQKMTKPPLPPQSLIVLSSERECDIFYSLFYEKV